MQIFFGHFLMSQFFHIIGKQYALMDFDHGPRSLFREFGILTENSGLKEGSIYVLVYISVFAERLLFTPKCCCFLDLEMSIWIDPIKLKCSTKSSAMLVLLKM